MKTDTSFKKLILKNRSYRRFHKNKKISLRNLKSLVWFARHSASSANLQPLKYFLSCTLDTNQQIFQCLKWAGYLKEWPGPSEDERPSAYIIVLGDTTISRNFGYDAGIAAQSILLGAVASGLGGCIVASIDRERLRGFLNIAGHLEILLIIALGKPKEKVVIETVGKDGDIKYWRDKRGIHHVPKRQLNNIIVNPEKI